MTESFVKSRRGILRHIEEGKLGTTDFAVFQLLLLLADKATGSCWVSSKVIAAKFERGDCSERQAKSALHRLKEEGYIKSFQEQGSKGSYPISIDKYEMTFGDLRGRRVITEQTVDWRRPETELCPDNVPDGVPDTDPDGVCDDVPPYSRPQENKSTTPHENTASSNAVHAQERKTQVATPAPGSRCDECLCKLPKHNPGCTKGVRPLKQNQAPVSSAPAKPRDQLREWNEDVGEFRADAIRRAIRYQLDVLKSEWYQKNLTVAFVRRAVKKLVEDTPPQYLLTDDVVAAKPKRTRKKYEYDRNGDDRREAVLALLEKETCPVCNNTCHVPGEHFKHCAPDCTFPHRPPCPRCTKDGERYNELYHQVDAEEIEI